MQYNKRVDLLWPISHVTSNVQTQKQIEALFSHHWYTIVY
jgi:hypothetical protein